MGIEVKVLVNSPLVLRKQDFDELYKVIGILAAMPPQQVSEEVQRRYPDATVKERAITVGTSPLRKYYVDDRDRDYDTRDTTTLALREFYHHQVLDMEPKPE